MATITVTAKQRAEKKKSGGSSGTVGSVSNQTNQNTSTNPAANGYKTYDSAGVIGGMDNGNYGIANPTTKDYSNYNAGVDFDARIAAAKASGASEDTIKGLEQMKQYTNDVRSGKTIPYGYGEGMGYGDRNTRYNFTLKDGSKVSVPVNATRYEDAAKLAGINLDDIAGMNSITYGTGSSAYAKPGYGFGTIMGPNDFTTDLRDNDANGRLANMNLMQLAYLSGRDSFHYVDPYGDILNNGSIGRAYNKGTESAGLGELMGGYNVNFEYPDRSLDQFIANGGDYSTLESLYGSAYAAGNNASAKSGYNPNGTYFDAGLPAEAQSRIKELQAQYQAAVAAGDMATANAAHAAAEAIRSQYGYSGGIDGSEYLGFGNRQYNSAYAPTNSGFQWNNETSQFDYGKPGDYDSEYKALIDELLNQILDRDNFSYDVNSDPLYQQYKNAYLREGQRAMNDTLASAASGAGGMNSYALSAAQQAQNYYDAQLGDKIPELYQLAYEMYLNNIDRDVQNIGLLQNLDETQYNRYRDDMSDYYNDRNFAYGKYRDDISDSQWQQQFNYNANRDAIADSRYDTEWNYGIQTDAYAQAMDFLSAGIMPSAELLSRAGLSQSDAQSYLNAVLAEAASKSSKSSTTKSSKSNTTKKTEDDETDNTKKKTNTGTSSGYNGVIQSVRYYIDKGNKNAANEYIGGAVEDGLITLDEGIEIATRYGIA